MQDKYKREILKSSDKKTDTYDVFQDDSRMFSLSFPAGSDDAKVLAAIEGMCSGPAPEPEAKLDPNGYAVEILDELGVVRRLDGLAEDQAASLSKAAVEKYPELAVKQIDNAGTAAVISSGKIDLS